MNKYEEKQERRRSAYEDRAAKAETESANRLRRASEMGSHIPLGQPILLSHHSERRHRADLKRIDDNMRKGVEAQSKAEHYARRAAGVGTGGISGDDPDAIEKLRAKVALLKQRQDDMKRINRQYKKNGGWDGVKVDPEVREACERMFRLCPYEKRPFPSYALTNNGAAIRAAEQRVAQLEKLDATPVREPVERDGARVYEDREENRIFIDFDLKPDARIRTALKSNGFRWKPSVGVWSGSLNDRTWQAALRIVEAVESENAS